MLPPPHHEPRGHPTQEAVGGVAPTTQYVPGLHLQGPSHELFVPPPLP